jgi:hypothetical protein
VSDALGRSQVASTGRRHVVYGAEVKLSSGAGHPDLHRIDRDLGPR